MKELRILKKTKKKISCIIQARLTSKRLKNKVLRNIKKKSILELIYLRIKKSRLLDDIIFIIPDNKKNKKLEIFLKQKNLPYFMGNEKNVFMRYSLCAKLLKSDIIVRVTADCPLIDGYLIDKCLKEFLFSKVDYLSNRGSKHEHPDGLDVEVFNKKLLRLNKKTPLNALEKEHVTQRILTTKNVKKKFMNFKLNKKIKKKYSVDTYHTFKTVKKIFNKFKNFNFSYNAVIREMISDEK